MKKLNKKGFTLIELLAVIVIMGILMVVAIPAVTRTIANTRKDSYINVAKQYVNQIKTLWAADGLYCNNDINNTSATVSNGNYFVAIHSRNDSILEEGGNSPWKAVTAGVVLINRADNNNTYSIYLEDKKMNAIATVITTPTTEVKPVAFNALARNSVVKLDTGTRGFVDGTLASPATDDSARPSAYSNVQFVDIMPASPVHGTTYYVECKLVD